MNRRSRRFRPFDLEALPSWEEALRRWQEALVVPQPPVEQVDVWRSCGRVLARDIVAREDVPGFARSLVDGVAVRSRDTAGASVEAPVGLSLAGTVRMGQAPGFHLQPGQAALVPTGGMLPQGCDAVVMAEEFPELVGDGETPGPAGAGSGPTTLWLRRAVKPGENVSPAGADVRQGQVVLEAGRRLRPQDAGILAGLGEVLVPVYRRAEVAILSTGSEVVAPHRDPAPGQIRDMNGVALAALVAQAGARPRFLGVAGDDREQLRAMLEDGLQSDMVVLSGGSSVGEDDWTARLLAEMGEPGIIVHGVKMAPGKPTLCAMIGTTPVVGLPGNPVSALVVFQLFARPALQAVSGQRETVGWRASVRARLAEEVRGPKGRPLFMRVALMAGQEGDWWARPVRGGSSQLMTMVQADGVILVPEESLLAAGTWVEVWPWNGPQ